MDIDEEYEQNGFKQLLLCPPVDNVRNLVSMLTSRTPPLALSLLV